MKNFYISVILTLFFSVVTIAQTPDSLSNYTFKGDNKFSLANTSLSNWSGGGESAISFLLSTDYSLEYKKGNKKWSNRLITVFGMNKQGANPLVKTDDKIEFTSNYGYKMSEHWFYSFETNFKTQFDLGYEKDSADVMHLASKFMSPGYWTISPGLEYDPTDNFKVYMSPLAARLTFVLNDTLSSIGAFGVDKGKRIRYELGFSVNANWKVDFNDHFGMEHNLRLYSNYLKLPQNIDVDYNGRFYVKATKYISVDFIVQAIYDDDIKISDDNGKGSRLQLKSVLGAGLTYSF